MRRFALFLAVLTPLAAGRVASATARADQVGADMAATAQRFLADLDEPQRAQAVFAFDSPERFNWHWIPRERKGLPFKGLKPDQRALAFGLLNTGLSTRGAIKATTIMSLEEVLRADEHGTGPVRDPELYFISVFGTPGDEGDWGWRIEGHHLALNYTLKNGRVVSATPFMFGSNPALVRSGPRKGLRNLADIEGPANALLLSLTKDQLKAAVVSDKAPAVTTTPNSRQPEVASPEGVAVDRLDPEQRQTLLNLVRAYAANFPGPIQDELVAQADRGSSALHFAWYGPADLAKPHAFRVQGPTLFIDFNDTQNDTNHIHTYYRSLLGDFGLPAQP